MGPVQRVQMVADRTGHWDCALTKICSPTCCEFPEIAAVITLWKAGRHEQKDLAEGLQLPSPSANSASHGQG
jgi:hypothetical protein